MRQWAMDPKYMCNQHLLGEHVEHHMFVGHINKRKSITGYIRNNCIAPNTLRDRHYELVEEMIRRGMNHKSPLPDYDLSYLSVTERFNKLNIVMSIRDLEERCDKCGKLMSRKKR